MTAWGKSRLLIYLASLVASAVALAGYADFDPATGAFDLASFNLYAALGYLSGIASSGLAALALVRGWGSK